MDILKARKKIFFVFVSIYIIGCPILMLYTLGFWFNPNTSNIVETGVISINTNPSGADIFLNNRNINQKTPAVIRSLPPGQYFILMRLKEYRVYKNRVRVYKGKAVVIEDIKLVPENRKGIFKYDI